MPKHIKPCLAFQKTRPPKGSEWKFEVKWDGYRLAVHVEPGGVRILTRSGHDWTHRFPAIAKAAQQLGTTLILDGEAVVLDEQGRSDFGALQRSLGGRDGTRASEEAVLMAFDLLYLDGHDLTGMELSVRRHLLESLTIGRQGAIQLSEEIDADGEALLETARAHGLEGIIAKNRDRSYRSGRTGDWLKIKCIQGDSFIIVGYEPSPSAYGGIGNLMLAAMKRDTFVYVGSAGTRIKQREAVDLRQMLDKLGTKSASVAYTGRRKNVRWCLPTLIAEIEYRAWTTDGKLRNASYKGLRKLQDNAAIYRIDD